MQTKNTNVLFVSVTEGRDVSSISNAISAAKMQLAVIQKPIMLEYRFEKTLADAIDHFHAHRDFDVLVAVDNLMGYPGEWVVENALGNPDKHVITGIYPLPGVVDWDRIRAKAADDREPNSSKGHVYNIALDSAVCSDDGRFVVVSDAALACVIVKRAAIDDIAARHPELRHDRGLHVHAPTLADGKKLTADQSFCRLYGKPIYADLQHPCSSFGTLQYAGICALRRQLR